MASTSTQQSEVSLGDAPFVAVVGRGEVRPQSGATWGGFTDKIAIQKPRSPIDGQMHPVISLRYDKQASWLMGKFDFVKRASGSNTLYIPLSQVRRLVAYLAACDEEVVVQREIYDLLF